MSGSRSKSAITSATTLVLLGKAGLKVKAIAPVSLLTVPVMVYSVTPITVEPLTAVVPPKDEPRISLAATKPLTKICVRPAMSFKPALAPSTTKRLPAWYCARAVPV